MKNIAVTGFAVAVAAAVGILAASCGGGGSYSPGWIHPADIDDHISFGVSSVDSGQVVMNDGGYAILVWGQSDTNFKRVYLSERDPATGTWTHPAIDDYISLDGLSCGPSFCFPVPALDNDGNAVVAWTQASQAGTRWIFVSERDGATGTWTHPADISQSLAEISGYEVPDVAVGGGGYAIVAWSEAATVNTSEVYFTQRSGVAGTWSVPEDIYVSIPISLPGSPRATTPDTAIDDSGDAVMTWIESSGPPGADTGWIFVSERDGAGGVWTHPTGAGDSIAAAGSNAANPRLAMAGNGGAVISWFEYDGANSQVYVAERDAITGSWTTPADLADKLSPDGSDARFNRSAVNSRGDAVVVWRQYDGSNDDQIFMSVREGGTGLWDNPADLSDNISPDGFEAGEREVDMDDSGHTVVAWKQDVAVGGSEGMFIGERDRTGGPWILPSDITDFISPVGGGSVGGTPSVAVGGDGNAVVVWRQSDGGMDRLYMSEKR